MKEVGVRLKEILGRSYLLLFAVTGHVTDYAGSPGEITVTK